MHPDHLYEGTKKDDARDRVERNKEWLEKAREQGRKLGNSPETLEHLKEGRRKWINSPGHKEQLRKLVQTPEGRERARKTTKARYDKLREEAAYRAKWVEDWLKKNPPKD
jgi:hypothetical protein